MPPQLSRELHLMYRVLCVLLLFVTVRRATADEPAQSFSAVSARTNGGSVSVASSSSSSSATAFDSGSSELQSRSYGSLRSVVRQVVTQRLREGVIAVRSGSDAEAESRRVAVSLAREVGPYVLRTQVSGQAVGDSRATATAFASVSIGGVMREVGVGCQTAFVGIDNGLRKRGARFFCSRIRRALAQSIFSSRASIDVTDGFAEDGEEILVNRAAETVTPPLTDVFSFLTKRDQTRTNSAGIGGSKDFQP